MSRSSGTLLGEAVANLLLRRLVKLQNSTNEIALPSASDRHFLFTNATHSYDENNL